MKQVITLSDNAANRIKEIISNDKTKSVGVRVGVKSGGCAGMSYIMEYAKKINPTDEVIEARLEETLSKVCAMPILSVSNERMIARAEQVCVSCDVVPHASSMLIAHVTPSLPGA